MTAKPLFEIRYYANSRKRLLHVSDPRGAYVATVYSTAGAPDTMSVREALPHQLRKAFDRSRVWTRNDVLNAKAFGSRTLHDTHGRTLGTLYATHHSV